MRPTLRLPKRQANLVAGEDVRTRDLSVQDSTRPDVRSGLQRETSAPPRRRRSDAPVKCVIVSDTAPRHAPCPPAALCDVVPENTFERSVQSSAISNQTIRWRDAFCTAPLSMSLCKGQKTPAFVTVRPDEGST